MWLLCLEAVPGLPSLGLGSVALLLFCDIMGSLLVSQCSGHTNHASLCDRGVYWYGVTLPCTLLNLHCGVGARAPGERVNKG